MKNLFLFLIISACLLGCRSQEKTAVNKKMNMVFFLVDDMGWTDLGCYGSPFYETPNIDQFARESVKFTNAYAACHVCSPTRASILTGKYPATLHLTDWLPGRREFPFQKLLNADINQHLPYEETTIAEALKAQGYSTAIFGKWHLGEEPSGPKAHGFDIQVPMNWNKCCPNKGYHAPFGLDGIEEKDGDYLTDRLTDEALKYIDDKQHQPFFLYLSHFAVHDPIQGRKDLVEKYQHKLNQNPASKKSTFILEGNPDDLTPTTQEKLANLIKTNEFGEHKVFSNRTVKIKQEQNNVEFAGMVESIDLSFGRVIAKLEALDLMENTIVIFFSDNGGMAAGNFGNPKRVIAPENLDKAYATANLPLRGAKGWLYEGGIREPLLIRWPGHGKHGSVCDVPVISTDFYPTILEMLDVPIPTDQKVDGVSIAALVKGEPTLDRNAIYWHFPHYSNHGMQSPGGAIRSGDYKLLEYYENGNVQLFNLKNDIGEQDDLSQKEPQKVAELRGKLHAWRKSVNAQMMEKNPDYE